MNSKNLGSVKNLLGFGHTHDADFSSVLKPFGLPDNLSTAYIVATAP